MAVLEPALIFATIGTLVCYHRRQFFAFCYNRCFDLLEPASIFVATAAVAFCWKNAQFCYFATDGVLIFYNQFQFLLPPVSLILLEHPSTKAPFFAFLLPLFLVLLELK